MSINDRLIRACDIRYGRLKESVPYFGDVRLIDAVEATQYAVSHNLLRVRADLLPGLFAWIVLERS